MTSRVVPVNGRLWQSIYYPIRDHLMEGMPPDIRYGINEGKAAWLEGRFAEMGIRLFSDGSDDRVWTHAEIPEEMVAELVLKWA